MMEFTWKDYIPESMEYVEKWLDDSAVRYTGLDEGFRSFYEYWAAEDGSAVGENFWCKVIFEKDTPIAVIAFCLHEDKRLIMEFVVTPEKRGCGRGAMILKELMEQNNLSCQVRVSEAVIFPDNLASQRVFEKAGFRYHHTNEDGKSVCYILEHRCDL